MNNERENQNIEFQPVDLLDPNKLIETTSRFLDRYYPELEVRAIHTETGKNILNAFEVLRDRLGETFPELGKKFIDDKKVILEYSSGNLLKDKEQILFGEMEIITTFIEGVNNLRNLLSE